MTSDRGPTDSRRTVLRPVGGEPPFDPDYDTPHSAPPPASRDAELALLAAIVREATSVTDLGDHVDPSDFYWPVHAVIWEHISAVGADPVLLNQSLQSAGAVDAIRLLPTLLANDTANPAHVELYAEIIRDQARLRSVEAVAVRLKQLAQSGTAANVDAVMEESLTTLDEAFNRFGAAPSAADTGLADLAWVLSGQVPEIAPPAICRRTDGTALFYSGKVNGIFGDPEAAKTWLAQAAGIESLNDGGTFAIIDTDHNGARDTTVRLLRLGARPEQLADPDCFRYYEPEDGDQLLAAVADCTKRSPTVTILDSLGEMFPMLGASTNDGDELTSAMRKVCTPIAVAGSCVITIDHLPKGADARSTGYAIGSIAKKRMIRGSYLRADARQKPAPGHVGRVTLRIEKDTAGKLRETSGGGYAGTFTLDSTREDATTWSIGREDSPIADDGRFRPTHLMEKASRYVEQDDQCTFRDIKTHLSTSTKNAQAAVECLVAEGFLSTMPGPNRSTLHHSIAMYREDEDDQI